MVKSESTPSPASTPPAFTSAWKSASSSQGASLPSQTAHAGILPGQFSPKFAKVFSWYTRRLFAKKFHAVRATTTTLDLVREAGTHEGPLIVLLNHSSWWDPLVPVLIAQAWLPAQRSACAPMDIEQLRKFAFFRRAGLFGINPDDARSYPALVAYVRERFEREDRATLWITPQGGFADVREPVRMRPGAAAIAARTPRVRVLSLAIEYGFWLDQKPEVFVHVASVKAPSNPSTPHWHAAMEVTMNTGSQHLSRLVIARESSAFATLVGTGTSVHPVYDWWLRLRGKSGALNDRQRGPSTPTPLGREGAAT